MYNVRIDEANNILFLTVGKVAKDEAGEIADTVLRSLSRMKKGFTCITDVSEYVPAGVEVIHYVEKCQAAMAEAGIARIIRVVGETPIPKAFMEKITPKIGTVPFHVVKNMDQARELIKS